ncbi:MAG: hypothetical protein ACYDCQ_20275, partial [Dehalococcoidia bacterium]
MRLTRTSRFLGTTVVTPINRPDPTLDPLLVWRCPGCAEPMQGWRSDLQAVTGDEKWLCAAHLNPAYLAYLEAEILEEPWTGERPP